MVWCGMGRVVCFHLMVSSFLPPSLPLCTVPFRPTPSYPVLRHLHSLRTILHYTQLLCLSLSNPTLSCPVRYYPSLLPVLSTSATHHTLQSPTPSSYHVRKEMVVNRLTGGVAEKERIELRGGGWNGVIRWDMTDTIWWYEMNQILHNIENSDI